MTRLSIVIPCYNEAENVPELYRQLSDTAERIEGDVEFVFVDDGSRDATLDLLKTLAHKDRRVQVLSLSRNFGHQAALSAGIDHAVGQAVVVMDADLQHPPEAVPQLVACIAEGSADFAIGSRYAGGSVEQHWSWWRRFNSWGATLLARPLTRVRDPMSGFFALHRDTWRRAAELNPLGYKIGLELLVKCGCTQPKEIPITFAARQQGRSKLTVAEQFRYLRHLLRLYRFRLWG